MTGLMPLTISIGILAGVATWIFLSVGTILIWAAFAAWACYFHNGGDGAALKSTIICNIFGVVVAWIAAIIILSIPLAESLPLYGRNCSRYNRGHLHQNGRYSGSILYTATLTVAYFCIVTGPR